MTAEQVAQVMMNRRGFFVVCFWGTLKRGEVRNSADSGDTKDRVSGRINAPYVIVGEATPSDLEEQCKIAGVPYNHHGENLYRAVAE